MIYNLAKPTRNYDADFDIAYSSARDGGFAAVAEVRRIVLAAYRHYDLVGGDPAKIDPLDLTTTVKDALKQKFTLTQKRRLLSSLRDEAMSSTSNGRCPMCGVGPVLDLDHYLPKEHFPEFSVLSLNLVPACARCNRKKRTLFGTSDGGRFLHAFYDHLPEKVPALTAQIIVKDSGVVVDFEVNEELPSDCYAAVTYHFDKLDLAGYYADCASTELVEQLDSFWRMHAADGAEAVMDFAGMHAHWIRKKFGFHHWKAALYDAVERNEEFCAGGFQAFLHR